MHFSLVTEQKIINPSFGAFNDVLYPLYDAFERLGFTVEVRYGTTNPAATNIIFGANNLPFANKLTLPKGSIIFNLEQYVPSSPWFTKDYVKLLSSYDVWDYSLKNCLRLKADLSIDATHLRLGFVDTMVQVPENPYPRTDILFYGAINQRREGVLTGILQKGVNLHIAQNVYDSARDFQLFNSKLVLNIHYYEPATLELPRLGYLFANRKPVISEITPETEIYADHEDICFFYQKDALAESIPVVVKSPKAYRAKAEAAFKIFSSTRQEDFLQKIVGRRSYAMSGENAMPRSLNIGSGKDFLWHAVNVDIEDHCNPDFVYDLSEKKLETPLEFKTDRFGTITLKEGCFSRIIAHDVLEHIPRLNIMMSNLLYLLEVGGELEIQVPYELSLGAWQDPTHVHAFNENSWFYYCDWAWYMGWRDFRFEQIYLTYTPTALGSKLMQEQHLTAEELLRIPRAIDSIFTILRKRQSQPHEQAEFDFWFRRASGEFRTFKREIF